MPLFQYKALQADGAVAEGQLEAAGRQEAFAQMAGLGLRPVSLSEKAAGEAGEGWRCPSSLASLSFLQAIGKGLRAGAGELHAAALEPAGGGRAAEPRAGDSLQGSLHAGRQREMEGNPRPGGGRHVAGRCDGASRPRPFRASIRRWCRPARRAGSWTWCWRRSPISRRGRRTCARRSWRRCFIRACCWCWRWPC